VLGRPDLATDPRYATNAARVAHVAELNGLIGSLLGQRGMAEWTEALAHAGVPCAPINTVPLALADPQIVHRQMVAEKPHPSGADIRLIASPIRFGEAEVAIRRAPPLLGEHDGDIGWAAPR